MKIREALRPIALTACLYSILVWVWVLVRLGQGCPMSSEFIDGIPIEQWETALGAFLVSAVSFWYVVAEERL